MSERNRKSLKAGNLQESALKYRMLALILTFLCVFSNDTKAYASSAVLNIRVKLVRAVDANTPEALIEKNIPDRHISDKVFKVTLKGRSTYICDSFMEDMDRNKDGFISEEEFCYRKRHIKRMRSLFNAIDKDDDGRISAVDIQKVKNGT